MARIDVRWPLAGVLSGLVIVAAGTVPAHAEPGARPSLVRMQSELGLSEDQRQAIRELHQQQRDARRQLARSAYEARRALRTLIPEGADEATIQAKTAEVRELVGQLVEMGAKTLQDVSQILTPEQRETLKGLSPRGRIGRLPLAG